MPIHHHANRISSTAIALVLVLAIAPAASAQNSSDPAADMWARLAKLEEANAQMAAEIKALRHGTADEQSSPTPVVTTQSDYAPVPVPSSTAAETEQPKRQRRRHSKAPTDTIGISPAYGFAVLDHAENVNRRTLLQLEERQKGNLDQIVTLSGRVSVIANAHWSNRANKFGYLMRHPSGNNQRTKATQEIAINSAQLAATITPTSNITGYFEMLYDPEQSFGAGTITALARNQIQMRKAYIMWGNLDKTPIYVAAGKMDVPFGLQDTVSPFTNSTNWHAFAPLAYGGQVGYYDGNLSVRAMAVGGGAQFRSANTPVDGTAIPSKVNNFALDASYRLNLSDTANVMVGGSYIHGSAYCQSYPIFHFNPCADNVPAWAAYGTVNVGPIKLIGEYAQTTKVWPGTQVPVATNAALSVFPAHNVSAFTFGGRYQLPISERATNLSFEFSKFIAGPEGSPWNRQNQWVAGLSHRLGVSVDVFGELIRTDGFVPLNFATGGNQPAGTTWSDKDARSNVVMLGVEAAF